MNFFSFLLLPYLLLQVCSYDTTYVLLCSIMGDRPCQIE